MQDNKHRLLKAAVHIQCAVAELDEIKPPVPFTKNMQKHLLKFDKYATKERELLGKLYEIDTEMMHTLEDAINQAVTETVGKTIADFVEIINDKEK